MAHLFPNVNFPFGVTAILKAVPTRGVKCVEMPHTEPIWLFARESNSPSQDFIFCRLHGSMVIGLCPDFPFSTLCGSAIRKNIT